MDYIEVTFDCSPNNEITRDILSAMLAEIGYESFVETDEGVTAYVQKQLYNEENLKLVLNDIHTDSKITYVATEIEGKDWNEEWEKNYFKPLVIDNRCIIQSTFHKEPAVYEYNIYIDPKMAFGTGHHQTTELMIREILNTDFAGKSTLDMGCGTAILAILASMKGANPVLGIDIDKWSYDNAIENLSLNNISNVEIQIGGAELLDSSNTFDIILANINRNILLNDIKSYVKVLNSDGLLYMSGFYTEDISCITEECAKNGLEFVSSQQKDNWAMAKFRKTNSLDN